MRQMRVQAFPEWVWGLGVYLNAPTQSRPICGYDYDRYVVRVLYEVTGLII
jgi:hypothetical protein